MTYPITGSPARQAVDTASRRRWTHRWPRPGDLHADAHRRCLALALLGLVSVVTLGLADAPDTAAPSAAAITTTAMAITSCSPHRIAVAGQRRHG